MKNSQNEIEQSTSHKSNLWFSNLSKSKAIWLFFDLRECSENYRLSPNIAQKRDITKQLLNTIEKFIQCGLNEDEILFLSQIDISSKASVRKFKKSDTLKLLKSIDNEGVELLELKDNVSSETLKKHYSNAAIKYTSDRSLMKQLNEVFVKFYSAILLKLAVQLEEFTYDSVNINATNYLDFVAESLLIGITASGDILDFLPGEECFNYLQEHKLIGSEFTLFKLIQNYYDLTSFLEREAAFKRDKNVKNISRILSTWFKNANTVAAKYKIQGIDNSIYKFCEEEFFSLVGEMPTRRFNLMHILQAENAYKYNGITEKRYKSAVNRLNKNKSKEKDKKQELLNYCKQTGLIPVLSCDHIGNLSANQTITGPGEDIDRFEFLTELQKEEYWLTFKNGDSISLINKYIHIRRNDYIVQIIYNYEGLDINRVRAEIEIMTNSFNENYWKFDPALELLNHLATLDEINRNKKLVLLKLLDVAEPKSSIPMVLDYYYKRIENTDNYVDFALLSVPELEKYQQTGEYTLQSKIDWNRDLEILEKYDSQQIAKQWEKAWLYTDNCPPEQIIKTAEPYIEGLLKIGKQFNPRNTGELQIGHPIDRLTASYGKLKNWSNVIKWCSLFFNLPKNYRDRDNERRLEVIKKRYERAKKAISKLA